MKKILYTLVFLCTIFATAQEFKIIALQSGGFTVKSDAIIKITDSLFSMTQIIDGVEKEMSFDVINKRNNLTYVTDGVAIHFFFIKEKSGKKKKQPYTHEIIFTADQAQGGTIVTYYADKIN